MRIVAAVILVFGLLFPDLTLADPSTLTIGAATTTVTGSSSTIVNFPVTRAGDTSFDAFVEYQTKDGSAVAGTNYAATAGSLLIPAGASSATIPVSITGSTFNQPDLNFQMVLLGGGGGTFTPSFAAQQPFATGKQPTSVAMVDLNGDGKPDLIVANQGDNTVSVMLNTTAPGASIPSFSAQQTFATGSGPVVVAAADLNGDGIPDLVVANSNDSGVSVLLNTTTPGASTASFATQQAVATGKQPSSLAIADLNGDGKVDLIVANQGDNTVSVLLNTTVPGSTASFSAQKAFAVGNAPRSVAAADVNSDGSLDLIVANSGSNTVSVLLNTTAPGASAPSFAAQKTFATGISPTSVAATDLNGDGLPEIIAANQSDATVSVLLNTTAPGASTPSFGTQHTFATGAGPVSMVVTDVNGDGKSDLVVASSGDAGVSVLLNVTAPGAAIPSFTMQKTFAAGNGPLSVAVADVNGDGKPDLVTANNVDDTASVLLNTTSPPATTFDDNSFLPQQQFPGGNKVVVAAIADMNGDGRPDLIILNPLETAVAIFLNRTAPGSATAAFANPQTFALSDISLTLKVADMNGDGKPDLIATIGHTISVLLNTTPPGASTVSFAAPQAISTTSDLPGAQAADVNGDGKPDLIVSHYYNLFGVGPAVSVLLNTTPPGASTLTFASSQSFGLAETGSTIAVADVNGDGKPDLVVSDRQNNVVSVLLNTAAPGAMAPSFAAEQSFATGTFPGSIGVADLNGDGMPDLVIQNEGDNTVSALLNTTAPGATTMSFTPQRTFFTGYYAGTIVLADVNGDRRPDIITPVTSRGVCVLLNTTPLGSETVSFAPRQAFATGEYPTSLAVADLNGDGQPDLVVGDENDPSNVSASVFLSALYQATASGSPATGTIHFNVPTVSATLGVAPARVNFGKVRVGQAKAKKVTLTNQAPKKSGTSISFGSLSISGSNAFLQSNNCTTLAPRQKCSVSMRFAPSATGSAGATLTVSDNARNSPQTIQLTGTGK